MCALVSLIKGILKRHRPKHTVITMIQKSIMEIDEIFMYILHAYYLLRSMKNQKYRSSSHSMNDVGLKY